MNTTLILVLGASAGLNAWYDGKNGKSVADPVFAMAVVYLVLAFIGTTTGQWKIVNVLAGVIFMYSFLVHGKDLFTDIQKLSPNFTVSGAGLPPTNATNNGKTASGSGKPALAE